MMRRESVAAMETFAGPVADAFIKGCLLPTLAKAASVPGPCPDLIRTALADPHKCLLTIFGHYAFARRGRERFELAEIAVEALDRTCRQSSFSKFLLEPDASRLWDNFEDTAKEWGRKPMAQLNRGVVAGMAELAQEVGRLDGSLSIAKWIVRGVSTTGRIEPEFLRMVDVRGVGPKMTSLFLRDVVLLFELESQIDAADRLYLQPIDKWTRAIAPWIIDEVNIEDAADWVLAGKMAKYARLAGVSGVRANIGMTQFGLKNIRHPENAEASIQDFFDSLSY